MLSSRRNLGKDPYSGHNMRDGIQEYLIGELPQCHVAAFEKALREDAHLAAQVHWMQRQNQLLRDLRSDILDQPVPGQLMDVLTSSGRAASRRRFFVLRARPAAARRVSRLRAAAVALLTLITGPASTRRRSRR